MPAEVKRQPLQRWREQLHEALHGHYSDPIHAALHSTVTRHRIPVQYLELALDGVAMDLDVRRYETFDDLYQYCYRVASVVGLSCIHVWGFRDERAKQHAEAAGIAFQLTNILRDLAEDVARDRIYLPLADLRDFNYSETDLRAGVRNQHFVDLLNYQASRALEYYEEGERLLTYLPPPGRAVFLVMLRTYRELLQAVRQRSRDVFTRRVSLSRCRKLWLTVQALPVRWGWSRGFFSSQLSAISHRRTADR